MIPTCQHRSPKILDNGRTFCRHPEVTRPHGSTPVPVELSQCATCPFSDNPPTEDTRIPQVEVVDLSNGPGTQLTKRFLRFGATAGINCILLAGKMNLWGPKGCRRRYPVIVHDIFPRARHAIETAELDNNLLKRHHKAGIVLIRLLSLWQRTTPLADYLIRVVLFYEVWRAIKEAEGATLEKASCHH